MGPRVVIIGASLAGLRSAEAVLAALPAAQVTLIGDEPHAPYNRPPLSKDAMAGLVGADAEARAAALAKVVFKHRLPEGAVAWRLGCSSVAVQTGTRQVLLSDGTALPYDWLIAATGLRPRRLPIAGHEDRRHVLRSFDDAARMAAAFRPGARMVVVGAGFIGCEIAATALKLGLRVCIVEPQAQPMLAALGPQVAAALAAFHRAKGVDLRCGLAVAGMGEAGIVLADGSDLPADVVIEAVGSIPNTEWLQGTGLDLTNGVLTDTTLTAQGSDRILAAGDLARFPNPLFGREPRRVEHWCVPGQTAKRCAETIAAREAGVAPTARFAPLPSFWSDQHGLRLQSFGAPGLGDDIRVLEGSLANLGQTPCLVEYTRAGRPVGLLGLGAPPAALALHRARLEAALNEMLAA